MILRVLVKLIIITVIIVIIIVTVVVVYATDRRGIVHVIIYILLYHDNNCKTVDYDKDNRNAEGGYRRLRIHYK